MFNNDCDIDKMLRIYNSIQIQFQQKLMWQNGFFFPVFKRSLEKALEESFKNNKTKTKTLFLPLEEIA